MSRPRSLLVAVAVGLVLASIAQPSPAATAPVITVGGPATSGPIPPGFLGLSLEYFAIPSYAGTDPNAIDPVFVQLVRNLAGGHRPEIRIGGDTTDRTWWPIPGTRTPAGVTATLTPGWAAVTRALTNALGARLTLGINLEADSATVARTEVDDLLAGVGRSHVEGFELGNEPELYGTFIWGHSGHPGRPRDYDYAAFSHDFTRIAGALPRVPLTGPAVGVSNWFRYLGRFLTDHPAVKTATLHRYPLESCYVKPPDQTYPTIQHLLSNRSTRALASSVAGAVRAAHARGVPLRVDEINTISCGWDPAVGRSFASALWALDTLFELARVGVDGVNFHTFPGATYALFRFSQTGGQWQGQVTPEYYGLDMFAQAAPAGSRLLTVSDTRIAHTDAFATRTRDGTTRVTVINENRGGRVVDVRIPGSTASGTLDYLTGPSLTARTGVTLAGQSFNNTTTTGLPTGPLTTYAINPANGAYAVRLPAASAAVLTVPPR
jgi:Glycosyl hydrolase family 79 C-terminal beta domain